MKWSEVTWSEVEWSEVKWSGVKWSELKWDFKINIYNHSIVLWINGISHVKQECFQPLLQEYFSQSRKSDPISKKAANLVPSFKTINEQGLKWLRFLLWQIVGKVYMVKPLAI